MNLSLILTLFAAALALALFAGMIALIEAGRRIGLAKLARDPQGLPSGGAAEAAVFGLLGLLIAFTFSGAAERFEQRARLVTQEANAIGTAYLRIDLAPADVQPELRRLLRRYLDVRTATYSGADDMAAVQARLDEGAALQARIWAQAVKASAAPGAAREAGMLMLPALNEMFDITTTRVMATRNHPPIAIFAMLAGMCLVGALLIGYDTAANRERIWVHTWSFAAVLALCFYVIIDLEYPRLGLIHVGAADVILEELRQSMR